MTLCVSTAESAHSVTRDRMFLKGYVLIAGASCHCACLSQSCLGHPADKDKIGMF
jgi:hypothetical protein